MINIERGKARWKRPDLSVCKLLKELPNNILDLQYIIITEGKVPESLVIQWNNVKVILHNTFLNDLSV